MQTNNPAISWWRIQYTESDIAKVADAIRAEHISLGPVTLQLEQMLADKLQVPYVVATTSGSMALLMALMVLEIGPGDEVIVPNRTWIAAAHAVALLGAKVVLVDVKHEVPIIDINALEAKITPRTKAIIPTALSGRAVNIEVINQLAKHYHLSVIEDAAQSVFSYEGSYYSGTQSDIGCFSLSTAKLLPTGQGGFLATRNKKYYETLISIRTHGVSNLLSCHFERLGFNFRFTDLQAALGLAQLETLDQKKVALQQIYKAYEQGLQKSNLVRLIPVNLNAGELPIYIEVLCPEREALVNYLASQNIQVKVFYPNLNRANYLACDANFPAADKFESQGITLPCGPAQSLDNIEKVVSAILYYEKHLSLGNKHAC